MLPFEAFLDVERTEPAVMKLLTLFLLRFLSVSCGEELVKKFGLALTIFLPLGISFNFSVFTFCSDIIGEVLRLLRIGLFASGFVFSGAGSYLIIVNDLRSTRSLLLSRCKIISLNDCRMTLLFSYIYFIDFS